MNKVCFVRNKNAKYPDRDSYTVQNDVSRMIKDGLHTLKLDDEHYETEEWNPLGGYVKPGDLVLIKPNLVLHENVMGGGTDCLYTHPSLIATMIDYVLIALKGEGRIIVGDAPVQDCVFDTLVSESGLADLIELYKGKGVDISLIDFRNVKSVSKNDVYEPQEKEKNEGITVRVDTESAFYGLTEDRQERFRITNYDPRIMKEHHYGNHHEYRIATEVLDADVIISMPKPKTHRKAGVTIALKNMVGINASKEYLPHHTIGSTEEGGDAYLEEDIYLKRANAILDLKNELAHEGEIVLAKKADELYQMLKGHNSSEHYWEGSWYGNDTIWRTITDLNLILLYADKKGVLQKEMQRKLFIVGDMVVSGEKEGPLEPSPIETGVIVMGDDPLQYDKAVCSLMGFDYHKIPSIEMPGQDGNKARISGFCDIEPEIISNFEGWNGKPLEHIREYESLKLIPSTGWRVALGDRRLTAIVNEIKEAYEEVYIFGAGGYGKMIAGDVIKAGMKVKAFIDNSLDKRGRVVLDDIVSVLPDDMDLSVPVIIGTTDKFRGEIEAQLKSMGAMILDY